MPTITVGIPFYNCQETLADAIRSVYSQTFTDWELILIDDGSTDGSLEIARSVRDDRVRVITDGVNKGIGARRAQIVELANCDYIAWQDADDLMHPDRLERQFDFLQRKPDVSLVDCWCYLIDPDDNVVGLTQGDPAAPNVRDMVKRPLMVNGCSLGRRQMYLNYPFDTTMKRTEDWDLWIRAIEHHKFAHLKEPLYYRRDLQSTHHSSLAYQWRELAFTRRLLLKHGPRILGWLQTSLVMGRYYLRALARSILLGAGLHSLIGESKRSRIEANEVSEGRSGVHRIKHTPVPGLD